MNCGADDVRCVSRECEAIVLAACVRGSRSDLASGATLLRISNKHPESGIEVLKSNILDL
jgi:hypothetical protein